MLQPLDRPVWATLSTKHKSLSQGGALALRYEPDVNLFASAADDSPEALSALARLVSPGEQIIVLQVPDIRTPEGLGTIKAAKGVQMGWKSKIVLPQEDEDIVALTDEDAADMLALATLTEPGPFLSHTHITGGFYGIRADGRLIAMAGERLCFEGFAEVSAVCTHPDFRGRGFARRLSAKVAARILARGETPFLHAWKTNTAAIALYESLGFQYRCDVNVAVLERAD